MENYTIKQRINTNSIPPHVCLRTTDSTTTSLCICYNEEGKCGIVTGDGQLFLPFEYDNISMIGFGLYALFQGGKLGLLYAKRPTFTEDTQFELIRLIPCQYDWVSTNPYSSHFVFLRLDRPTTSCVQVFFVRANILSEPLWKENYTDGNYLIATDTNKHTQRIFDVHGNQLYAVECDPDAPFDYGAYETYAGTVFAKGLKGETVSLILAEKKRIKRVGPQFKDDDDFCFELTGSVEEHEFDRLVRPILSSEHLRTYERPFALGFIIERDGIYSVLDGRCKSHANGSYDKLSVITTLECLSEDGERDVLSFK